jgi:hypothetical protein
MQTVKNDMREKDNAQSSRFCQRIGSTLYEVNVYFNPDSKETMDDKILRIMKNDLNFVPKNATMAMLQMGGLPKRSSL